MLAARLEPLLLTPGEAVSREVRGRVQAAVLVGLYESGGELHAVLTRRRHDLRRHAGEISFPGGRRDEGEELLETALREAQEEIGLDPAGVTIAGALEPTPTIVTNYAVYPFVGAIEPGQSWVPSAVEVADVLELSLTDLLAGHERRRMVRRGVPFRTDVYVAEGHVVWGATARVLADLLARVAPLLDEH